MSEAVTSTPETGREGGSGMVPAVIIVALLVGGFLLMTFLSSGARDRALDRSPIGVAALSGWLAENGVEARQSHPRIHPALEDLSLRVLPLYDLNLERAVEIPATRQERLNNGDLRDISRENFETKVDELTTVVLLPKWRGAAAEMDLVHEQALIPIKTLRRVTRQIGLESARLVQGGAEFATAPSAEGEITLFHAQTFVSSTLPDTCRVVQYFGEGATILRCWLSGDNLPVYVVSDPDLFNNHGLSLGNNAAHAVGFLDELRDGSELPIYVDTSPNLLTIVNRTDERQDYERGSEEISRFLQYPFSMIWATFLIVVGVAYWRGAFRFGPLKTPEARAWDQSKEAAIAAKARILRLSGNDGVMVADFVATQLRNLSADYLGHGQADDGGARFFRVLARRDANLAAELSQVADDLVARAPNMTPQELERQLKRYQTLLKKVIEPHGSV